MKKIFLIFCALLLHFTGYCQTPATDPSSWGTPTWADEFSLNYLDATKWDQSGDWRNGIDCHYLDANNPNYKTDLQGFRTNAPNNMNFWNNGTNGIMTLITKRETTVIPSIHNSCTNTTDYSPTSDRHYTSPKWLMSKPHFKYGYFEIKMRLPNLQADLNHPSGYNDLGLGANFWLWNCSDGISNSCWSEIDINEFLNYASNTNHSLNTHYTSCDGTISSKGLNPEGTAFNEGSIDFSDGNFQTFGAAWFPNKIEFYHNNNLIYISNYTDDHYSDYIPMPIIVDVNVFTYNPIADPTNSDTKIPYNYDVDYVRTYSLKTTGCNSDITINNFTGFDFSVYRNITYSPNLSILSGENRTLRATSSITINAGFDVQIGAIFNADVISGGCPTQIIN